MQRFQSTMMPSDLEAWRERHRHSLSTGAEALGISKRMLCKYLAGNHPIPMTVALLVDAIDKLKHFAIDDRLTSIRLNDI